MSETIQHIHSSVPSNGNVSIEVEKNSKGYNWKVRIDRPIEGHDSAYGVGIHIVGQIREIEAELKSQLTGEKPDASA